MNKAVILLSSGLDSTVNFYKACEELDVVLALTFDYGQRAAVKEMECAKSLCKEFGVEHKVLDLRWFQDFSGSSLTNIKENIPVREDVRIDDLLQSEQTAQSVWVPNRNGVFLNIAAAYAEGLGAKYVIPGFNLEEAKTFPDNSQNFLNVLDQSFLYSTATTIQTKCFTTDLDKTEIVKMGRQLHVNFERIWPCYFDGEQICGECESCQRFLRATQ